MLAHNDLVSCWQHRPHVAWKTPLEFQWTPNSTPFQSCWARSEAKQKLLWNSLSYGYVFVKGMYRWDYVPRFGRKGAQPILVKIASFLTNLEGLRNNGNLTRCKIIRNKKGTKNIGGKTSSLWVRQLTGFTCQTIFIWRQRTGVLITLKWPKVHNPKKWASYQNKMLQVRV